MHDWWIEDHGFSRLLDGVRLASEQIQISFKIPTISVENSSKVCLYGISRSYSTKTLSVEPRSSRKKYAAILCLPEKADLHNALTISRGKHSKHSYGRHTRLGANSDLLAFPFSNFQSPSPPLSMVIII